MQIYSSEKEIAHLIRSNAKSAVILDNFVHKNGEDAEIAKSIDVLKGKENADIQRVVAKIVENPHPALAYASAILVSTVWNRNDDVLLAEEVWKTKETCIDTPFNDNHEAKNIIGHLINYRILNEDRSVYEQDTCPEYFDIETDFVMYQSIFPDKIMEIAEGVAKGEKFVSMEALMAGFDYAFLNADGTMDIIQRNEQTSFLTKYLRIYGGKGVYDGRRVGRVLRNFVFVGMGSVDRPANADSEYTDIQNIRVYRVENSLKGRFIYISKGNDMVIENLEQAKAAIEALEKTVAEKDGLIETATKEATELKSQVEASTKELTETKAALEVATKEATETKAKAETLEAQAKELTQKVEAETAKVAVANQAIEDLNKTITTEKATAAELVQSNDAMKESLKQYKKAESKNARIAKMKKAGMKVKCELEDKIADMSDEAFEELLAFTQAIEKVQASDTTDQNPSNALDNANPDKTVNDNHATASGNDDLKAVAKELVDVLNSGNKAKKNKK